MGEADLIPELEATVARVVDRVVSGIRWKFIAARSQRARYEVLDVMRAGLEYEMRLVLGLPTPGNGI